MVSCCACNRTAYPAEAVDYGGRVYHRSCFKCAECKNTLTLSNARSFNQTVYCKHHMPRQIVSSYPHNLPNPVDQNAIMRPIQQNASPQQTFSNSGSQLNTTQPIQTGSSGAFPHAKTNPLPPATQHQPPSSIPFNPSTQRSFPNAASLGSTNQAMQSDSSGTVPTAERHSSQPVTQRQSVRSIISNPVSQQTSSNAPPPENTHQTMRAGSSGASAPAKRNSWQPVTQQQPPRSIPSNPTTQPVFSNAPPLGSTNPTMQSDSSETAPTGERHSSQPITQRQSVRSIFSNLLPQQACSNAPAPENTNQLIQSRSSGAAQSTDTNPTLPVNRRQLIRPVPSNSSTQQAFSGAAPSTQTNSSQPAIQQQIPRGLPPNSFTQSAFSNASQTENTNRAMHPGSSGAARSTETNFRESTIRWQSVRLVPSDPSTQQVPRNQLPEENTMQATRSETSHVSPRDTASNTTSTTDANPPQVATPRQRSSVNARSLESTNQMTTIRSPHERQRFGVNRAESSNRTQLTTRARANSPYPIDARSRDDRYSGTEPKRSTSGNRDRKGIRRVLFIGPTGSGKSTLINILINNDVSVTAMSNPAKADDTAFGQTALFTTYYDFPDNAYTDSIGLGDHRFKAKDVMESLKSVLRNASIGYNKIYICLEYGRISSDTRRYIELVTTMFGNNVLQWSSIIFTHCNDQKMTKEKYLMKNRQDNEIITIINQVATVIFGDNMTDDDMAMEAVLSKRRRDFLDRIKTDLDQTARRDYFQLPKKSLITRAQNIAKVIFGSIPKVTALVTDIKAFAAAVASSMQSSKYRNYFGECSICTDDITDDNRPVMAQCGHIYHEACLMQWVRRTVDKHCSVCRAKFNEQQNFYISLTADP